MWNINRKYRHNRAQMTDGMCLFVFLVDILVVVSFFITLCENPVRAVNIQLGYYVAQFQIKFTLVVVCQRWKFSFSNRIHSKVLTPILEGRFRNHQTLHVPLEANTCIQWRKNIHANKRFSATFIFPIFFSRSIYSTMSAYRSSVNAQASYNI